MNSLWFIPDSTYVKVAKFEFWAYKCLAVDGGLPSAAHIFETFYNTQVFTLGWMSKMIC